MENAHNDSWRTWLADTLYGETLNRRARGELPEMESAKATAKLLAGLVRGGDSLADVGCGCGHYLPTFRQAIAARFSYTGLDATPHYLELARETFAGDPEVSFVVADVMDIPFPDESFDVVVSANMLLHLPSIDKALGELVRIARRRVLVRTLVGARSFVVKEVKPGPPESPGDEFEPGGRPRSYSYYNVYSEDYVRLLLRNMPKVQSVDILPDMDFDMARLNADTSMEVLDSLRTKATGGMQVLGYLLMPWAFISIGLEG